MKRILSALIISISLPITGIAQHYQSDFQPEEFRARWDKIFDQIGSEAVAVVQGAPQVKGFTFPRQTNTFYYLSGIETPFAYLMLDGRSRKVTLFLPARNERLERSEGKVLSADDGQLVRRLTGVDEVLESTQFTNIDAQSIFVPFSPGEQNTENRGEINAANAAIAEDHWDGRQSRGSRFIELIRTRHPSAEIMDLTPILDEMRLVKSPKEIELLRMAGRLSGLAVIEAMKSTTPGAYEYQLDAVGRYVFQVNGARQEAYRSIIAAGTENIINAHYFRNTSQLKSGDLILMDYAPDYHYYVSDIGRMWPVSGKYSDWQRELIGFVLIYHEMALSIIKPGMTTEQIMDELTAQMEPILKKTTFSKRSFRKAAVKLLETGGGVLSHSVGMAVHDVGNYRKAELQPGMVFSVDPQLRVPEENLYIRYEDTILITENGIENLTDIAPRKLSEIEALIGAAGMIQNHPALDR